MKKRRRQKAARKSGLVDLTKRATGKAIQIARREILKGLVARLLPQKSVQRAVRIEDDDDWFTLEGIL
jgi:hypothetical protein